MPAPVAACVYAVFIAWLLLRSSRTTPSPSLALWIPTVWIGIMLSKPVMYWFNTGSSAEADFGNYLDGSPLDRNILSALMCAGLAILANRRVDWATLFSEHLPVWIFYAYAATSVLWSPYPSVAGKRVIRDLGGILMGLVVLTEPYPVQAIRRVFIRCAVVLVPLSVLLIKYYPEIGRYYHRWTYGVMYAGVTTNKNSLGVLAMVSGLFLLWHLAESSKGLTVRRAVSAHWPEALVVGLCVWILSIANSATSTACFVLGAVAFIGSRQVLGGTSAKATAMALTVVGVAGWVALWVSGVRGWVAESLGRDATLTTRTDIWSAVLDLRTNPTFGAGFASVWLTPEGWALSQELKIPHAHNGYLETYLNGGVIGVGLLIVVLFGAVLQAARHLAAQTPAGPFFVAFVLTGVVYNFSEVTFNNNNAVGLLLWLIALSNPYSTMLRQERTLAGGLPRRKSAFQAAAPASGSELGLAPSRARPRRGAVRPGTGQTRHRTSCQTPGRS